MSSALEGFICLRHAFRRPLDLTHSVEGHLLCALPHDSHGRAHRSSPQKPTCITHAPVVSISGSCALLNLRGFRLRYPVQLFTYPFEAPARLPVLVSPHLPPLHLTTENLTSPLLLKEGGPVAQNLTPTWRAAAATGRRSWSVLLGSIGMCSLPV